MKFYETEPSLKHGPGDILKLKITTHQETKIFWGFIVENADGSEFLVLLDAGIIEEIDCMEVDKILTTEDTYEILRVYKNLTVRLE